jgi:heme/copper-type cytochrome/quinol oxidase subunit 3
MNDSGSEAHTIPPHYHYSIWPAIVGLSAGVLVAGVILLLKGFSMIAGLVLVGYFTAVLVSFFAYDTRKWSSWVSKSLGRIPRGSIIGPYPVDIGLTIQMLLFTEFVFFGGAFGTYFYIRSSFPAWPPPNYVGILDDFIPRVQTLVLITSSILIEWAIWQLKRGRQTAFRIGLIVTTILGSMFSVLQLGFEYPHLLYELNFTPASGFYGASFYILTGIHGAHVLAGIAAYLVTTTRALAGHYSQRNYGFVEAAGTYWHFVHIIWLFLFALIWHGAPFTT